jgi:hypothetical protein
MYEDKQLKPIDVKNLSEACKNYMDLLVERDGQRQDRLIEKELKALEGEDDGKEDEASREKGTLKSIAGGKASEGIL